MVLSCRSSNSKLSAPAPAKPWSRPAVAMMPSLAPTTQTRNRRHTEATTAPSSLHGQLVCVSPRVS